MYPVTIKFVKTHPLAVLPVANHKDPFTGDTGLDLVAVEETVVPGNGHFAFVDTWATILVGLKLAYITPGYWFRIEGRSGIGFNKHMFPHFGIIDNPYRGDLAVKMYNEGPMAQTFKTGDKVAQIVVYPLIQANTEFVDEVSKTSRGEKGFGSSDMPNYHCNPDSEYSGPDRRKGLTVEEVVDRFTTEQLTKALDESVKRNLALTGEILVDGKATRL